MIEAYGTGIKKILTSYEKIGLKPIIKSEIGVFQVVLPNIHYIKKVEDDITKIKDRKTLSLDGFSYKNIEKNIVKIKPLYMDILDFIIKNNGATKKEIQEYIKLSQTRVIILLKEMLELNLIKKEKDKIDRRAYKYYRK